jgi:class 3 adenylate cyclase
MTLPSGTVTFLFTDIEGCTKLAQECPEAMPALLARHHEIRIKLFRRMMDTSFSLLATHFVQLFAWADATREKTGIHRTLAERGSIEKDLAVIHSKVDDAEFANLAAEGSTMTVEQAIALALEE